MDPLPPLLVHVVIECPLVIFIFCSKLRYLRKSCFLYLFHRIYDTTNNLLSESIESHRYQVCWKAIENNPTLLAKSRLWPWSCVLMSTSPSCQVRTKRCQKNSGICIWNFIFFSEISSSLKTINNWKNVWKLTASV